MLRMNESASMWNSRMSPLRTHSARYTSRVKREWYVSVGVNAVKSYVPTRARAQA